MKNKQVQQILPPAPPHMVGDGFKVHNFFPNSYTIHQQRMSPFFMLDYNAKTLLAPSPKPKGVGVHPHRGFETVTIAYHGRIAHTDSYGNHGIIGQGEVQWMTAASGILHKEYHDESFSKVGGLFQMVQLWVNLPAKDKMNTPKYQGITTKMMEASTYNFEGGQVEVIAGNYENTKGAASTHTPIEMYNLRLKKGAILHFDLPAQYNTGLLMIEGSAQINDTEIAPQDHFVLFANQGSQIKLEALEDAVVLVLSGQPINEPIASYGPFLMNTQEELQQAVKDYNSGKFGILHD
jgi:redox-sensitive bicupin YhaK (pirin superfamily)